MKKVYFAICVAGAVTRCWAASQAADPLPIMRQDPVGAALLSAESPLASVLQRGLFEEEANLDYTAAAKAYETLIRQYDDNRKFAATAVFRLAECYRKMGRTNEAVLQYERVAREFQDHERLAEAAGRAVASFGGGNPSREGSELYATQVDDDARRIRDLVKNSPDLLNSPGPDQMTPLQSAALRGRVDVAELLIGSGAAINGVQAGEHTPLHFAANVGQNSMVEYLISKGANPNATTYRGVTPLHMAASHGYEAVMRTLLTNGARVDVATAQAVKMSSGPLAYQIPDPGNQQNPNGTTPLGVAAGARKAASVKLLLNAKADPNLGKTPPLIFALSTLPGTPPIDQGIVQLLLAAGANPNARSDGLSEPVLHLAARGGPVAVLKQLLSYGADVNGTNASGLTALHLAAASGQDEMVRSLLERGADPNALDRDARSPLDYAKSVLPMVKSGVSSEKHAEVIALLRKHGALDEIPRQDRIVIRRGPDGSDARTIVVQNKNPVGSAPFTLMDIIGMHYGLLSSDAVPTGGLALRQKLGQAALPFPDFKSVRVVRRVGSANLQTETVDLLATNCAGNVEIEWGDTVEIFELPHPISLPWEGLGPESLKPIMDCLLRKVKLTVHGQSRTLELTSKLGGTGDYPTMLRAKEQFWLTPVLLKSGHVLSTSDLTRVKVRRLSENKEWILDCSMSAQTPEFWLKDGDEIEVQAKTE